MKFKKFNLVVGKRQIVIASLLVTLSVAAFLNWQFATGDQAVTVMDVSEKTKKDEEESSSSNYGEAELVSKNTDKKTNEKNLLQQARLDRATSMEDAIDNTNNILKNQNLTEAERNKAIEQSLQLTKKKNKQEAIESQIKTKNVVNDCISYIDDNRVNVIVETDNLTDEKVAQIKDSVVSVTNAPASNIVVTPYQKK